MKSLREKESLEKCPGRWGLAEGAGGWWSGVRTLMLPPNLGEAGVAEICSRECRLCLVPFRGHLELEKGVVNK